ncbi:hypothetical protein ACH5AO_23835 [Streptomyces sp. NPDC018964]|uniref:hypothetical protein n=1 Tax=unclassified Streptomyces TaxID=2593676 RepID=UPI003794DD47
MKRFVPLLAAIAMATGAAVSLSPSAVAAPASAQAGVAWWYSQADYQGSATYTDANFTGKQMIGYPVKSVINKSGKNFTGSAWNYSEPNAKMYCFWNGGSWSSIGSPFSSTYPLTEARVNGAAC